MQRQNATALYFLALILLVAVGIALYRVNLNVTQISSTGYDLLARWGGARAVFENRGNPYSPEVTADIQRLYYGGRLADEDEDQVLFAYPYHVLVLVAPFALIDDFNQASAAWMTLLQFAHLAMALVSLRWAEWRPRPLVLGVYLLFTIFWYLAVRSVMLGNPAVMVALFIALALLAIQRRQDELAGVCLALATIKPQMVILLLVFVLVWAVLQRRTRLVLAFLVAQGVLMGAAFALEPAWLSGFLSQVVAYGGYTFPATPAGIFGEWWGRAGVIVGWVFSGAVALWLFREWGEVFRRPRELFAWGVACTLTATFLIGIPNPTSNQLALLPVLPFLLGLCYERWPRAAAGLTTIFLLVLGVGLWALFLATLIHAEQPTEHLIMHFPLPLFLWLALAWMRWWALNPHRRMPIEAMKAIGRL